MAVNFDYQAAVQDILSRGLSVAQSYVQDRLRVNNPAPNVTGPGGNTAQAGQAAPSQAAQVAAGVPVWVWIAGSVVLGVLVLAPLLRSRG
jgi:hypothetical protein